jgi:cyclic pyranopterin phosphate synthase
VRVAARYGCELRFVELMPFGDGAHLFAQEFLSAAEAFSILERSFTCLMPEPPSSTAKRYRFDVDGTEVVVGFISPMSHPFCEGCNRLRLDSFGRLYSCLRSKSGMDIGADLKNGQTERLRQTVVGGAAKSWAQPGGWPTRSMVQLGG